MAIRQPLARQCYRYSALSCKHTMYAHPFACKLLTSSDTGHGATLGPYTVQFTRDRSRQDVQVDCRLGWCTATPERLTKIDVLFNVCFPSGHLSVINAYVESKRAVLHPGIYFNTVWSVLVRKHNWCAPGGLVLSLLIFNRDRN